MGLFSKSRHLLINSTLLCLFALFFSTEVLADSVSVFQGDRKAAGDEFDEFKSKRTVQVAEKVNRIKREKITEIRPPSVKSYMASIRPDGRLEKFFEIINHVNEVEADSCGVCWSVFNKLATGAKSALAARDKNIKVKAEKKNGEKEDPLNDGKENTKKIVEEVYRSREPNLGVIEASRYLFIEIAISKESEQIREALDVLAEHLNKKDGKTIAEQEYFSSLAHYMMKPFWDISGEDKGKDVE